MHYQIPKSDPRYLDVDDMQILEDLMVVMYATGAVRRSDPREAVKDEAERAQLPGKADELTEYVRTAIAPGGKLHEQLLRHIARRHADREPDEITEVRPVRRETTE